MGAATLGASLRAGAVLLAFYLSSSKLTRWQEERKAVDDAFRHGGRRDWVQVRGFSRLFSGVSATFEVIGFSRVFFLRVFRVLRGFGGFSRVSVVILKV